MAFDLTGNPSDLADDDIVAAEASPQSVLEAIKEELKKTIKTPPIVLNVPERPGMTIRFDTTIESGTIQMWRKQCRNKSMPDEFDSLKFSCIILANKAEAVLYDGVAATFDDGEYLNFKEPRFLDMLGVPKALEGVRRLYGVDGHIFVAADEVLRAAGYDADSEDQTADPTLLS